jgi:hypothetical protein
MHDRNQLLRVSQRISGKLATSLQPGTDQERGLARGDGDMAGLGHESGELAVGDGEAVIQKPSMLTLCAGASSG